MTAGKRRQLLERAAGVCEYCRMPLEHDPLGWHVDHIVPRQHGGSDTDTNLAVDCARCNFAKGPNLSGIDRSSGLTLPLFDPRTQRWHDHFTMTDAQIVGVTPIGRATVQVLQMNVERRVQFRRALLDAGLL